MLGILTFYQTKENKGIVDTDVSLLVRQIKLSYHFGKPKISKHFTNCRIFGDYFFVVYDRGLLRFDFYLVSWVNFAGSSNQNYQKSAVTMALVYVKHPLQRFPGEVRICI